MLLTSLYITVCSAKNRLRRRLARLREPRYFVGAIVGAVYLYFAFFARARSRRASRRAAPEAFAAGLAAIAAVGPPLAGGGLLEFSEAETDFLFPAPIARRSLLLHRLVRSQAGMLFGAVVFGFASQAPGWMRLRVSIATWLLFLTVRVYFTVVTLTRTRARAAGSRLAAWPAPAACATALAIVVGAIAMAFRAAPPAGVAEAVDRLADATTHGICAVVLWPTVTLARPFFAASALAFAKAIGAAAVVLAATVVWMLRSDEAFADAAADAARRRTEARAPQAGVVRARRTGLTLALTGPPEAAFFWKNGVQTLRLAGVAAIRILVALLAVVVAATSAAVNALHFRGGAAAACTVALAVAAFTAMLGPQIVRTDLRSDLLHLELLKTWPVRSAAVVRGEIAWPAAMLTVIGWAAILAAATFSPAAFPDLTPTTRVSSAAAALLLMPSLVGAQYLVQNAAALAFPAWVPLGNQRPRGVDAMGQRLIVLGGALLSVLLLMIPGAVGGFAIWLALRSVLGAIALVPASATCTGIVLLEILAGTELLGPVYERLDLLAVERPE